jgi:hypothetical protein
MAFVSLVLLSGTGQLYPTLVSEMTTLIFRTEPVCRMPWCSQEEEDLEDEDLEDDVEDEEVQEDVQEVAEELEVGCGVLRYTVSSHNLQS